MQKEKRVQKTKEELEKQMATEQEQARQRKFVKEVFYPFLLKNTKTPDEAKRLITITATALLTSFQSRMLEEQKRLSKVKVPELKMDDNIPDKASFKVEMELLDLFKEEDVATTESLLRGMNGALDSFLREHSTKMPLSELKTEFL